MLPLDVCLQLSLDVIIANKGWHVRVFWHVGILVHLVFQALKHVELSKDFFLHTPQLLQ